MPVADRLSVVIEAQLAPLKTGLAQAEKDVARFSGSATKAVSDVEKEMQKAGVAFNQFGQQVGRGRDALGRFTASADAAGRSSDNFGRQVGGARDHLGRFVAGAGQATIATTGLGRATDQASRSFDLSARSLRGLVGQLGGIYAAQRGAQAFVQMADEATRLEGRLRLVTNSTSELTSVQQQLFRVSQDTRTAFASNVELYARAVPALKQLGATQKETVEFTRLIGQAFTISGATAAESSSSIMQLSQALGSGTLRGEEFNSINEQGARVMQALADSLGVSRGQLRGLAEEGKLTSEIVFKGLLSQASKLEAEFARVPRTVGAALVQLQNDLLRTVDGVNKSTEATGQLVAQVDELRQIVSSPEFASGMAAIASEVLRFAKDAAQMVADIQQLSAEVTVAFQATANAMINTFSGAVEVVSLLVRTGFEHGFGEAGKLAYNVVVEWLAKITEAAANAANELVITLSRAFEKVNEALGVDLPNPFASMDFDATGAAESVRQMKAEVIPEVAGVADEIDKIWKRAMAGDAFAEATGSMLEAKYGARQVTEALQTIAPAASTLAPLAGAIDAGVTKPSKEAAKALREAEAAKKALFSEADAAVAEFFPMAQAEAEAARLTEIINNTSNGLSDLQRNALGMQIAKNFEDAVPKVENLRSSGVQAAEDIGASFIDNVGDVFVDVFSQATRDGESFFGSLIKGFAGLGSQLAAAGGKNLIGQLLGIADPTSKSAAGIGAIGGGSYGGLPSISPSAGVGMSFASSAPQIQALNRNMGGVGANVLKLAQSFDGLNERSSSQLLNGFLSKSGTTQLDAKTQAWCAAFANAALMENGIKGTGSNMASSFLGFGNATNAPKPGDIVVLKPQSRGTSGHVGFVAGFGDGTVQVFGGNQSNAAKTSSYSTSQVAGYRTYDDERVVAKGVSKGMTDFSRSTGYDQGAENDPWNGMRQKSGAQSGGFGQTAMGVAGAGLGIFSQGYQSGSPISGGLGGAMGGFQAGSALFPAIGAAGPIGAVAGAALGVLGGILGGRAEREAKHREAQAAWEEQRPAYEQFDRSLSGEGNGELRGMISGLWDQLNGFMQTGGAAWKYGEGNSSEQFESTGTKMWTKVMEAQAEFREGFTYMLEDLSGGEGLEGAFAKGRGQVKALDEQIKGFIDDVSIAFISSDIGAPTDARWNAEAKAWEERRNAAIEQAKRAAGDYALTLLYTADAMSDVQKAIDSFRGTAAGLQPVLVKLGWSAEEAATAIAGKLNDAISAMGKEFVDGFQREINSLSGVGYLDDVKDLLKDRDTALSDAALLGVDPTVVTDWFALAAQDIVDGSELTGSAFDGLIAAFPQLAGVVKSFTESVEASADAIKARSLGYQDRLFAATTDTSVIGGALSSFDRGAAREREEEMKAGGQAILDLEAALAAERLNIIKDFNDRAAEEAKQAAEEARDFLTNLTRSIKEFTDGLRSGAESPLAPKDRLAAAQSQYDAQLALVKTGDRDAANGITGYASDLIEANKAYNASSPAGQAITNAIIAQLEALPKQVSAEQFIVNAIKDTAATQVNVTAAMQEALRTAFAAGPQATAAALSSSFSMLDTSLDGLLDYNEMRAALTGIATDAQVRTMMNVLDSNGDGQLSKLELITASNNQQVTQLAGQNSVLNAINAATQSALGNAVALYGLQENHRNISLALLQGQQLSNARGFMTGGYTGDGPVNAVAGVVHGQEGVLNAGAMRSFGRQNLDAWNRGTMRMPAIAMPVVPQMANDNRGLEQRMASMERAFREEMATSRKESTLVTRGAAEHGREGSEKIYTELRSQRRSGKMQAAKAA